MVTVLFSDIVQWTNLSSQLPPEQVGGVRGGRHGSGVLVVGTICDFHGCYS